MIDMVDKPQILGDFMVRVVGADSSWVMIWGEGGDTCLITNVRDRDAAVAWLRKQADILEARCNELKTTHLVSRNN
jgi:hypothetical protein